MKPVSPTNIQPVLTFLAAAALFTALSPQSLAAEPKDERAATAKAATVKSSDGIPLVYEVHGNGPTTVVLVHGWSCDRSYWKSQIGPLPQKYKVVTLDLAGHGESPLGRKAWTIASFGDDVATVVKALGLQKIVLVGHSMGGDVAVDAARALPGRASGLIWIDTYSDLAGPPRKPEEMRRPRMSHP